jgi:hypothetical protein
LGVWRMLAEFLPQIRVMNRSMPAYFSFFYFVFGIKGV